MYKTILVATDGSEISQRAVAQGIALAAALKARIVGVTVTPPWYGEAVAETALNFPIEAYAKAANDSADRSLSSLAALAKSSGVECKTVHLADKFADEGVLEVARAENCDLIVMGSHGRRGLRAFLLGSQSSAVIAQSDLPVLLCR